jgi:uncharacterized protein YeaO (DUF488 family)
VLVKWVQCRVPPNRRLAFGAAQAGWSRLSGEAGLVGQLGGWDVRSPEMACLVAIWRSRSEYETFMARRHDELVAATDQAGTYSAVDTAVGDVLLVMPGTSASPAEALVAAGLVRVADCRVRAERTDHFRSAQERIWVPGMAESEGMLGGWFSDLSGGRFLVTTLWKDPDCHAAYVADRLPELRERAEVDGDVEELTGRVLPIEPSWRVLG